VKLESANQLEKKGGVAAIAIIEEKKKKEIKLQEKGSALFRGDPSWSSGKKERRVCAKKINLAGSVGGMGGCGVGCVGRRVGGAERGGSGVGGCLGGWGVGGGGGGGEDAGGGGRVKVSREEKNHKKKHK